VTWGPKVFIANVKGPWINPDAMPTDALTEIAHVCVSGAIRYKRKDGQPDEPVPAVNLISVRENGPYALRANLQLDGAPAASYRLTLCRCGASKNKPFCDGSHNEIKFAATGEPATGKADMLPVRDGTLAIDPQVDVGYESPGVVSACDWAAVDQAVVRAVRMTCDEQVHLFACPLDDLDDRAGNAGAVIDALGLGWHAALMQPDDDGLRATPPELGKQRIDGVGLVAKVEPSDRRPRGDGWRCLQGHAHERDGHPVGSADLIWL
jgi:CDGSH-type Zn-finger protein